MLHNSKIKNNTNFKLILTLLLLINSFSLSEAQYIAPSGGGGGGSGTVTSLSVVTANGFAGSVATATTTPAITLTTTVTGNVCSNATALSACSVTGSGATVLAASPTITGTLIFPTPFTLGATSVTSTGVQLNYLSAATGTTGTTSTNVVFSTSPTLVTPALGVASATSVAVNGATIGTNALAVTGTANISGNATFGAQTLAPVGGTPYSFTGETNSGVSLSGIGGNLYLSLRGVIVALQGGIGGLVSPIYGFSTTGTGSVDGTLSRSSSGVMQFGSNAANAAGSWLATNGTLSGTAVISGTADASAVTGSGALQVAGGASIAKRFWIPAITASAGLQTAVLCQSSGGEMIADSVACLASSERFKTIIGVVEKGALDKLMSLPIYRWQYNKEGIFSSDEWTRERIGPTAEETAVIDPRLVGYGSDGKIRNISTDQLLSLTIQALQELKADNDNLREILLRRAANGS